MILYSFHKLSNVIFNCELMPKSKIIKIEKNYLNEDEENSYELNSKFNKSYCWSFLKTIIPSYCCFINDNNDFIIQIVVVGFNKCNISNKRLETDYKSHIICKKRKSENKKQIIQTNNLEENID